MLTMKRRKTQRWFHCDISGCQRKTQYVISRREVSTAPLHICDECIRDLYAILAGEEAEKVKEEPKTEEPKEAVVEPKTDEKPKPKQTKTAGTAKKTASGGKKS